MGRWIAPIVVLAATLCSTSHLLHAQGGQPSLTSVIFKQSTIAGGRPATATISISGPAGNNGFEVSLSLTSSVAQLSSSAVTIGSGLSSATVPVTTTPTSTSQLATLTATARGETRTANLTVAPPTVLSLGVAPSPVTAGQQATGTITLNGPAPSAGTVVTLARNNAAVTVQSSATVPQGQNTVTFPVTTGSVTAQTAATITASVGAASRTATLTVLPAGLAITSFGLSGTTRSGEFLARTVRINIPAPAGGLIVHFASTGVDMFGSLGPDTMPAGQTFMGHSFRVPVTSIDRSFTITATLNGVTTTASGTLLAPRILALNLIDSALGGTTQSLRATVNALPPSGGIPVVITADNPAVQSPGSVSGSGSSSYSVTYLLRTNPVTQRTPVTITLTYLGSDRTESIVILPPPPVLTAFSATPATVRAGGNVQLTVTLNSPAPSDGSRVQVAAPPILNIPSSILVPAGATSASVTFGTPGFVPSSVTLTLTASFGGVSKSASVRIDP